MSNLELAKCLTPPDFLEGEAIATWKELAPQLYQLGFLESTDVYCLAVYCEAWAQWLELHQQDDPDMELMFKLSDIILDYSDKLGLNPAARLQIQRNLEIVITL